jgi:BirA family biotin operon repressor/biotin-[acetyl-CoA-carboxylase] ligase
LQEGDTLENKAESRHSHRRRFSVFFIAPNEGVKMEQEAGMENVDAGTPLSPGLMGVDGRQLDGDSTEPVVFTIETCTSTMDVAWRLSAEERFPDWASVLSATQTTGRGQFGRNWHSPEGNLYGTLRIPRLEPVWSELLPLLLAESMRVVLGGFHLSAAIKWPNDLLIGGRKVGGILVEERSDTVMAGVGLNLVSAPPPGDLRHRLAPPAGYLSQFGVKRSPLEVWIPFVHEARSRIGRSVMEGDPRRFVAGITAHLAYMGEPILLDAYETADRPAVFLGLDAHGAIRVRTCEGVRIFRSGSVYSMM